MKVLFVDNLITRNYLADDFLQSSSRRDEARLAIYRLPTGSSGLLTKSEVIIIIGTRLRRKRGGRGYLRPVISSGNVDETSVRVLDLVRNAYDEEMPPN